MFLPNAVNVGFTLGVAFIIGAGQIPNALGLTGLPVHHELVQNLGESIMHIGNFEWFAATVFAISWFSLYNCQKRWPKVPWSILLSMVGIALGYALHHYPSYHQTSYLLLLTLFLLPNMTPIVIYHQMAVFII
jgi:MFS superfamily sulfate permease-like transporter